jgi:hypothetical protein
MRVFIVLAVCTPLIAGCESMSDKIAASRQDRCERADWKEVGLRDGVEGVTTQAERYQMICGELFQPGPYQEGLQQGLARRPRPPV